MSSLERRKIGDVVMNGSHMESPSHSEIAARAEQIYVESGRVAGRDLENWVQAENELKQRSAANGAASKGKATTKGKNDARGARSVKG
jgi:hypothetical protein